MYSEAQMAFLKTELADMIRFWNYDNSANTEDSKVQTGFFEMSDIAEPYPQNTYRFCN